MAKLTANGTIEELENLLSQMHAAGCARPYIAKLETAIHERSAEATEQAAASKQAERQAAQQTRRTEEAVAAAAGSAEAVAAAAAAEAGAEAAAEAAASLKSSTQHGGVSGSPILISGDGFARVARSCARAATDRAHRAVAQALRGVPATCEGSGAPESATECCAS